MSLSQFGYPPTTSIASTQLLMSTPTSTSPSSAAAASPCCENGRPIMTDPHTGQTICSCQYPAGLLAAYSRLPGLVEGVYPSPYAQAQGIMSLGATDPSAFYPPMGLSGGGPCYTYDPTMGAYQYGNGFMDPNARRKNATRESTNTLKAWLSEHRKNPYPTKGEKIMLAIITKMTLTQVSTWFANARRRLKKENKMTWSPRNRCEDDDEDGNSDGENSDGGRDHKKDDDDDVLDDSEFINVDCDKDDEDEEDADKRDRIASLTESELLRRTSLSKSVHEVNVAKHPDGSCHNGCPSPHGSDCGSPNQSPGLPPRIPFHPCFPMHPVTSLAPSQAADPRSRDIAAEGHSHGSTLKPSAPASASSPSSSSTPSRPVKPKIWSLADVATSDRKSSPPMPSAAAGMAPSHAGPIRHGMAPTGLPAGMGRSWAANGLSHPYGLPPHFLGFHRDSAVGGLMSPPTTSAILSRFGFAPLSVATSSASLAEHSRRLQGGVAVPTPANR